MLPAPSCAETWICRCSSAWLPEGLPLLDPGAPAQVPLPDHGVPEGTSLAVRSTIRRSLRFRPASRPSEDVSRPGVRRSFLGRPPIPRLDLLGRSALATAGTNSSGASDRLVRKSSLAVRCVIAPKSSSASNPRGFHRLPAEIGLSVLSSPRVAVAGSPGRGGDFRPDHNWNLTRVSESRKAESAARSLWITGILAISRESRDGSRPSWANGALQ